jgi:GTP-binding protein
MNIKNAELVISAAWESQYPDDMLPEIVLLGRSNVGKSSFINQMIRRKGLARTSSQPGKTQTMNFYRLNDRFYFVDMPGYGYAKVSKKEREKWGEMIETYLTKRQNIIQVIQLIDSRHEPSEDDMLMYNWLTYYEKAPMIINTKIDKVPVTKRQKRLKHTKEMLEEIATPPYMIPFSTVTGEGKDIVWEILGDKIEKGFTVQE